MSARDYQGSVADSDWIGSDNPPDGDAALLDSHGQLLFALQEAIRTGKCGWLQDEAVRGALALKSQP